MLMEIQSLTSAITFPRESATYAKLC